MRPVLVLLALASCGETPPPTAPVNQAEPRARETPPPTIAWGGAEARWKLDGLPAVARGGELVVVPVIENDSARGNPNLAIDVRDRSDHSVQTVKVLTADESEKLAPGGQPSAALQQRIADANRALASLHGLHDLVAMHPLEVQAASDGLQHFAIGDGLDVDWNGDHLHVFRHNASRSFITLDGKPWLAKPSTHAGGDSCTNPAFLAGVHHATAINVLVVAIGYKGNDTCWQPSDQHHVVAW
jgi:hypothetical protein